VQFKIELGLHALNSELEKLLWMKKLAALKTQIKVHVFVFS